MPTLADFQASFVAALMDETASFPLADAPVPGALGLLVHRNNVLGGLAEALGAQFPVVRRLVGDAFFTMTALEYLRGCLPDGPVMIGFGGTFASFLDMFPPAASVPYLGDVARLEYALHEAYHAADDLGVTREALAGRSAESLSDLTLTFHSSLRLVASDYPIDLIWRMNQPGNEPPEGTELPDRPACLLVARPHEVVETTTISQPAFVFVSALAAGANLAAAQSAAGDEFDGAGLLLDFFDTGLIAGAN